MGFFSFTSSPSPPKPKISKDGTPIAPSRSERSRCWEARDVYFHCLDASNIVNSIKDKDAADKACGPEGKEFEMNCATSWVQYFKKRRVVEFQKGQIVQKLKDEGAEGFEINDGPPSPSTPR